MCHRTWHSCVTTLIVGLTLTAFPSAGVAQVIGARPSVLFVSTAEREHILNVSRPVPNAIGSQRTLGRQSRGALIGAGIGLIAGSVIGSKTFDAKDGEPNGKLIALSTIVGGILGLTIGASTTY